MPAANDQGSKDIFQFKEWTAEESKAATAALQKFSSNTWPVFPDSVGKGSTSGKLSNRSNSPDLPSDSDDDGGDAKSNEANSLKGKSLWLKVKEKTKSIKNDPFLELLPPPVKSMDDALAASYNKCRRRSLQIQQTMGFTASVVRPPGTTMHDGEPLQPQQPMRRNSIGSIPGFANKLDLGGQLKFDTASDVQPPHRRHSHGGVVMRHDQLTELMNNSGCQKEKQSVPSSEVPPSNAPQVTPASLLGYSGKAVISQESPLYKNLGKGGSAKETTKHKVSDDLSIAGLSSIEGLSRPSTPGNLSSARGGYKGTISPSAKLPSKDTIAPSSTVVSKDTISQSARAGGSSNFLPPLSSKRRSKDSVKERQEELAAELDEALQRDDALSKKRLKDSTRERVDELAAELDEALQRDDAPSTLCLGALHRPGAVSMTVLTT